MQGRAISTPRSELGQWFDVICPLTESPPKSAQMIQYEKGLQENAGTKPPPKPKAADPVNPPPPLITPPKAAATAIGSAPPATNGATIGLMDIDVRWHSGGREVAA